VLRLMKINEGKTLNMIDKTNSLQFSLKPICFIFQIMFKKFLASHEHVLKMCETLVADTRL